MNYGFNYLPTVDLVEHFLPFWIQSRVTFDQMRRDLLTMRALHARFVRFHLMPANPLRDSLPGTNALETVAATHQAMKFANEIGLDVHLDIWSGNLLAITPDEVALIVRQTREFVQSYQIGNEAYHLWAKPEPPYGHLLRLIKAGKAVDASAGFSVDIWPADLQRLRANCPELYALLDKVLIHFYATSDQRGWTPVYVEQLIDFCGGANRFAAMKDERFVQSEFYVGTYAPFEKEQWITEITGSGYHRYSNVTPEEIKAANWGTVCTAIVERTSVKRVGHHSFRDKMSWREFGQSQCGVVWMDGSPKPLAAAFSKMAAAELPAEDLGKWVDVTVTLDETRAVIAIKNRSEQPVRGELHIETTPELVATPRLQQMVLAPQKVTSYVVDLKTRPPVNRAVSHLFARFAATDRESRFGVAVGWGILKRERPIELDTASAPFAGVKYVDGIERVREFFKRYPAPAVIFGNIIGFDAEMAYRIRSVLQALGGRFVPIACAAEARSLLDNPIIVIGNPERNFYAKLIEAAVGAERRVTPDNKAFLTVISTPFQYQNRSSPTSNVIGYAYCPACLYIAGMDDDSIRRAVYDLIRRIWLDNAVKVYERRLGDQAIVGRTRQRFRVRLDPGPYTVKVTVGEQAEREHATILSLANGVTKGPVLTRDRPLTLCLETEIETDHLDLTFDSEGGQSWAVAEIEIAHQGLLAEYRHFLFVNEAQAAQEWAQALVVTPQTRYAPERGYGWIEK